MVQPFSVFRRADRPAYLVAFKNEVTGRYLPAVSTRKEKYADAVKQANGLRRKLQRPPAAWTPPVAAALSPLSKTR
jgi:hypothetical protein